MILLKLFLSLALPILAGYVLLSFLFRKKSLNTDLGLALGYGLGLGLLSMWMLFLGMARIHLSVGTIGLPLIVAMFIFLFLTLKKKHLCPSPAQPLSQKEMPRMMENSFLMKVILFLFYSFATVYIFYYVGYVFWRALNIPIMEWDAVATHAFKAKVFFFERMLYQHTSLPHSSFPLFVPFILTWIAFILGEWHEQLPQIIFPLAFLSYLVIQYRFLILYTNRRWALGGIILLVSSNFLIYQATIAYTDFFMLYYNCTAILLLFIWNKKRDDAWLILASVFSGFMTFTKLEGTGYLFIHTILFLFILYHQRIPIKEAKSKLIKFMLPAFSMCLVYYIYKTIVGISASEGRFTVALTNLEVNKMLPLIKEFLFNLFLSGNWSLVWFLLVLSLLNIDGIKRHFEARLALFAIMLYFGLYFVIGLLTDNPISHIEVLSRVILHFFPLSVIAIILINAPSEKGERDPLTLSE